MNELARKPPEAAQKAVQGVLISPEYLDAVRAVEQAEMNQNGADKSWAYRALEQSRRYFAAVQRG